MQVGKYRGAGKGSAEPQSVDLSGRAAPLMPSVHDVGSEVAGVKYAMKRRTLPPLSTGCSRRRRRLPRRSMYPAPSTREPPSPPWRKRFETRPHLAEGTTGARPELAQVFVASEGIRDRDIAHLAVVGVNRDQ